VNHIYPELGNYLAVATVTDKDGGSTSDRGDMTVVRPKGGRVVLAAGDIADCLAHNRDELTAQILDQQVAAHPTATVLTLGDNAYPDGRLEDYMNCYDPTWGRHKNRADGSIGTYAALGNHDYFEDVDTPKNADGSFAYFGAAVGQAGTQPSCVPDPAIGRTCEGYFSIGIADWHIVFLNDEILKGASSPQTKWLVEDLAANTKKCQLAVWHRPRFLSAKEGGVTVRTTWKPWWDRLYAAGADIVLNAHEHFYERHHPLNPDGVRDDATGIRQFMVGTGGESMVLQSFLVSISPTSAVRGHEYGVLKLTLYPNAYEWQFIPVAGSTFTDSGSGVCH
jgi:acid phosphatase type 7